MKYIRGYYEEGYEPNIVPITILSSGIPNQNTYTVRIEKEWYTDHIGISGRRTLIKKGRVVNFTIDQILETSPMDG
jgi:hypothetical protein